MAAAFAERERSERGLDDVVDIHSGGTDPADTVHKEVVEAMAEVGIDISDRTPEYVADLEYLKETQYLITMGCSISKFNPEQYGVESQSWDLANPDGQDMETVREVRDTIETRVETLFDDVERQATEMRATTNSSNGIVGSLRDAWSR
ncbi:protein tyrosine phosphatase [Halorubrum tebenquichense DSM 14210]|uniref:Protein tyrosine phosphatase n=2 Tax=Halorubrum tebenquichense TaxID=119434 RepID=M0DDT9_9EURY|nr:protein tyrosine phosphatase [Halorubrum tebenquichense DSM 14210]